MLVSAAWVAAQHVDEVDVLVPDIGRRVFVEDLHRHSQAVLQLVKGALTKIICLHLDILSAPGM